MEGMTVLSSKAIREMERYWQLRQEAVRLLDLISAEFKSDPMSVQCFDLRIVEQAIATSDAIRKIQPTYRA